MQTFGGGLYENQRVGDLGAPNPPSWASAAWAIHDVLIERFIVSFDSPPEELVFDFDATNDVVHGKQEGRFFHGFYDNYCFLPLSLS